MTIPIAERTDRLQGYRGRAQECLDRFQIGVWSEVDIVNDSGSVFTGVILPRSETADDLHIVVKLFTGYNVGIAANRIVSAKELGYRKAVYKIPEKAFPFDPKKKNVTLLGTGGTIASRLDYRTGAVIPAFTPGELYGAVPELADIANLKTIKLFGVFSENMGPEQYIVLAKAIGEEIANGADGIVVGHGTDTDGPHRSHPEFHGTAKSRTYRPGRQPAQFGPAVFRRGAQSDGRRTDSGGMRHCRSHALYVRTDVRQQ